MGTIVSAFMVLGDDREAGGAVRGGRNDLYRLEMKRVTFWKRTDATVTLY